MLSQGEERAHGISGGAFAIPSQMGPAPFVFSEPMIGDPGALAGERSNSGVVRQKP